MHNLLPLTAIMLALSPALAAAQQNQQLPDPMDPTHPVPQSSYQSAFGQYQAQKADEKETPEKRWIGVNQQLMPKDKSPAQAGHEPAGNLGHGAHKK